MKILQINIRVNKGSVSRITEQIGLKVMEQGWESFIAYGRPSNPSKSQLIQIGTYNGVKWHYMMSNLTGRHGLFSSKATKKLIEQIKEIKPDIIHLQNIHGYYINYRVLFEFLNTTDIPIVWTLHDCWSFTGHCSHFVTASCKKWKTGCYDCPLKKAYPRSLFFDFSRKDYALKKHLFTDNKNLHFVPVSHWLEGFVKQSYFRDYDIRVIHNGIDLGVFRPYTHHFAGKCKILGVASLWNKDKGLEDFFKLSQLLDKNIYEITLVGLSAKQMETLPENIVGVQRTDTVETLAKLYSDADVFLNLTYADTLPTVNMEALACGTPVITYRTGGSPEIINDKTGIVVEQGNIGKVVEALDSLFKISENDRVLQRTYCRELAEQNYDRDNCFEKYINLYKEICSQKN